MIILVILGIAVAADTVYRSWRDFKLARSKKS